MTEPANRRQQPSQQRSNVAVIDDRNDQTKAIEYRKKRVGQVAMIVKESARDLERLLPAHIALPTFLSAAGAALWKSQDLMDGAVSDPDAFLIALRESARLGHIPGTEHYWLTPRKAKGRPSVLGIEGYEGIVERMYRSGGVLSVHADVVRANDMFEEFGGPNSRPSHRKAGGVFASRADRGDIVGVYAYAMLPGGMPSQVVTLTMEDLMELKALSAAGGKLWTAYPVPMYKKSALRRLEPYVPVSAGYRETQAQASILTSAVAPASPVRMEDEAGPAEVDDAVEGVVEDAPRPVTDIPFKPEEWGGDPQWEGLSVARPGEGVPPGVRGDG
jgi:recombination protein RecT